MSQHRGRAEMEAEIAHQKANYDEVKRESIAKIAALQSDLTKAVRLAADYGIERDALQIRIAELERELDATKTAGK